MSEGRTSPWASCDQHCGRDCEYGYVKQWIGPFGIGVRRWEITLRFWLPSLSWVWGYWR